MIVIISGENGNLIGERRLCAIDAMICDLKMSASSWCVAVCCYSIACCSCNDVM